MGPLTKKLQLLALVSDFKFTHPISLTHPLLWTVCISPKFFVEILTLNAMIFGDEIFGR